MDIRQTILAEMRVLPEIDAQHEISRRVSFIKKTLLASGLKNLVLGISGGVDSSTCGRLAQLAVDELNAETASKDYRFVAVRLPYGVQADEEDAQRSLKFIQPSMALTVNIKGAADSLHDEGMASRKAANALSASEFQLDFTKGNVKARQRMVAQYDVAGILGALVFGTDHSAENITGFYIKYGGEAVDLAPLFGLNKRHVRVLVQTLGVPLALVVTLPTADLESLVPGEKDEGESGRSKKMK